MCVEYDSGYLIVSANIDLSTGLPTRGETRKVKVIKKPRPSAGPDLFRVLGSREPAQIKGNKNS